MDRGGLPPNRWVRLTCWRVPDELVKRGRWPYLCTASNYRVFPAKKFLPGKPASKYLKRPEKVCGVATIFDTIIMDTPQEVAELIGVPCRLGTTYITYDTEKGEYRISDAPEGHYSDPAGAVLMADLKILSFVAAANNYRVYTYAVLVSGDKAYPAPLPAYSSLWETIMETADDISDLIRVCGTPTIDLEIARLAEHIEDIWLNAYEAGTKAWNTVVFIVLDSDRLARSTAAKWWNCSVKLVEIMEKTRGASPEIPIP